MSNTTGKLLKEESPGVQAHLEIFQSVIERMATNSAACKGWCITVVSAILVLVADKGKPDYALIAVIPNLLFLVLDTYYLWLEKQFRHSYKSFVEKLHNTGVAPADLYDIELSGDKWEMFCKSIRSISIWLFYLMLLGMILIVWKFVIPVS